MFRIQPPPFSFMPGIACWARSTGAFTFSSNMKLRSSFVVWLGSFMRPAAALFTRTSTGPKNSPARSTSPSRAFGSERSPASAAAEWPADRSSSTALSRVPGRSPCAPRREAFRTTEAPSLASRNAIAFPIPRLAPVTNATLPSHRPIEASSRRGAVEPRKIADSPGDFDFPFGP